MEVRLSHTVYHVTGRLEITWGITESRYVERVTANILAVLRFQFLAMTLGRGAIPHGHGFGRI